MFINTVHQHHGIVLTVGLNLKPSDVYALAEAGVDGFEYVNYGHKPLPAPVREAMRHVQKTKGIALVASNDWHGWTGALNAWTTILTSQSGSGKLPADVVMNALRQHNAKYIIPTVSHPVHLMSVVETITAPFTSVYLYAQALSKWQLLSWWIWAIAILY